MTFDRVNTAVLAAAAALTVAGSIWAGAFANARADDLRAERERTEQVRLEACATIAESDLAALCINGKEAP